MSASHTGICHICGKHGPLSFEHVPPKAAFNNREVILMEFEKVFNLSPDDPLPRGKIQQRGAGGYTLCERCNNVTGGWYGGWFVDWCYQAANHLMISQGNARTYFPYYIYPLSVIKQIITMFFSINSDRFREAHPELVEFVLNKERKYLTPEYGVFVYYNFEGRLRSQNVSVRFSIHKSEMNTLSEITFPPFGYVLTFDSSPPDDRLFDITYFSEFDYDEWYPMQLKMPVLPTHLGFPGDYRTKEEIYEQVERSKTYAEARAQAAL